MIDVKKIQILAIVSILLLTAIPNIVTAEDEEDLDPLVDLEITVTIKEIRALDWIDLSGYPDFYVKVFINDVEHESPIWHNQQYVKPNWSITQDVPDDKENVDIKIELWDWNILHDKKCDISRNEQDNADQYDVNLIYNIPTGYWMGDDYCTHMPTMFDRSGYGRLNGCDDNSIYKMDRDCEIWFDITQNDYDGDGIPYLTETEHYGTDPEIDDTGRDYDEDGIPIEWEHKWGYDPFTWDNHSELDPDNDGIQNIEEYMTSQWESDPFRQDIFFEIDEMEIGPNGEGDTLTEMTKNLLRDAFSKHNIIYHIDDGCMGGGGELVPFNLNTTYEDLQQIYMEYFMHNNTDNWRRGVFHYTFLPYHAVYYCGFAFATSIDGGYTYRINSYVVSTGRLKERSNENRFLWTIRQAHFNILHHKQPYIFNKEYRKAVMCASVMMHESGHTLGIFASNSPGCDNYETSNLLSKEWREWKNYESCMNYGYTYALVDYSDGSHGENDFDDWSNIDLTFFETDMNWGPHH